jgi:hypothetical protein
MSFNDHNTKISDSKYVEIIIDTESEDFEDDIENECCICFETLDKNDLAILNCNHKYHYKCIGKWMESILKNRIKTEDNFCPLCTNGTEIKNVICRDKIDPKKIKLKLKKDKRKKIYTFFKNIFKR